MSINISEWTQSEKLDVLQRLLAWVPGPQVLGDPEEGAWFLPLVAQSIGAGVTCQVSVTANLPFKPHRLLILEPMVTRIETERTENRRTVSEPPSSLRFWRSEFWEQRIIQEVTTTTREHKITETYLRGNWRIHSMLVGAQFQFPSQSTLSGDLFGPDGTLEMDADIALPAMPITAQVENAGPCAAPFIGIVLGKRVKLPRDGQLSPFTLDEYPGATSTSRGRNRRW